jgi:hypothetical protein
MKSTFWSVALVAAAFLLPGCASSGKPPTFANRSEARAYFEVLRSDFNTTKIRSLNEVMKLTPEEADRFWPIYRSYERDLAAVGDRKLALVLEFMRHHKAGTLMDQNSQELGGQFLQNAQDRLDLWRKYHQQISAAVSPIRAAQFLQVEHQLALFVDISIASEMPVVGAPPK